MLANDTITLVSSVVDQITLLHILKAWWLCNEHPRPVLQSDIASCRTPIISVSYAQPLNSRKGCFFYITYNEIADQDLQDLGAQAGAALESLLERPDEEVA